MNGNVSLSRAIRGPITLITIGLLFALNNFDSRYGFEKTWPVILIVFGLLSLLRRGTEPPYTPPQPPYTPAPPRYPYNPPPAPAYNPPAAGPPGRGGFGTTAPARPAEPAPPAEGEPPAQGGTS